MLTRDELEQSAIWALQAESYDDAVSKLKRIADLGYPPPTERVNSALEAAGSKVRLWEGVPSKVCVNGPHGGGCDITYPMTIRKVNAARNEREFDCVIKIRWDRDGGWLTAARRHIAKGAAYLITNKIARQTTAHIAQRIGIIGRS